MWFSIVGFLLHAPSALLRSCFSDVRESLKQPELFLRVGALRIGATMSAVCNNAVLRELSVSLVEQFWVNTAILLDSVVLKSCK